MCSGNCLIACSDEIDRDRTAVVGEYRQSPVIAAKTRTYREFNAHVFHKSGQREPRPNGTGEVRLGQVNRDGPGVSFRPSRPMGGHKRGELEAAGVRVFHGLGFGQNLSGARTQGGGRCSKSLPTTNDWRSGSKRRPTGTQSSVARLGGTRCLAFAEGLAA